jgi:phage shock protein A
MGIFQIAVDLLRSNINDLIARAENPEKMLNQVIDDMRNQLAKARQEVAHAIADASKLKKQADDEQKQAAGLGAARHAGRAPGARRPGPAGADAPPGARPARPVAARDLAQAPGGHRAPARRAAPAEREDPGGAAEEEPADRAAEARRGAARIHETMSGLSDSSAFEAFDRMAEKIEQNERMAIAAASVTEELTGDSLDREFKVLEAGGGEDVDYRLLEMKQQLGILPAAAPGRVAPAGRRRQQQQQQRARGGRRLRLGVRAPAGRAGGAPHPRGRAPGGVRRPGGAGARPRLIAPRSIGGTTKPLSRYAGGGASQLHVIVGYHVRDPVLVGQSARPVAAVLVAQALGSSRAVEWITHRLHRQLHQPQGKPGIRLDPERQVMEKPRCEERPATGRWRLARTVIRSSQGRTCRGARRP